MVKFKPQATKAKPTILASNHAEYLTEDWDGKSLFDIAERIDIERVFSAPSNVIGEDGKPIVNLLLEMPDKIVAFSYSRGFDEAMLSDERLQNCQFYVRKKIVDGDAPGEPTGPLRISFGKPSGITFDLTTAQLLAGEALTPA